MPVTINDFEMTVEPPSMEAPRASAPASEPAANPTPRPDEVERLVRFLTERRARVVAD